MIIFQTPEVLVLIPLILFLGYKVYEMSGLTRRVGLLNIFAALILLLAVSGPQLSVVQEDDVRPSITVIEDGSESSSLIHNFEGAEDVNIERRSVNSDSDNFESQVRSVLDEDEEYVFVSDLQFESDLPQHFVENNISMNLLTSEMDEEHAVRIKGPSETVIGAENSYTAMVSSTEDEKPEVEVELGNETIESGEPPLDFDLSFENEGYRELSAEINTNDEFSENDEYFKAVNVKERPEVASIGQESGLEEDLSDFYEINSYSSTPSNLDDYESLILKQEEDSQELRDYLVNGGGLMYTGSDYSADYLPVEEAERPEETDAPLIVFTLDISIGTDESGAAESGKQIAYSLVEGLPDNSRVGVVAYNRYAYDIVEPTLLAEGREEVQTGIAQLEPEGPTFHNYGLRAADSMIDRNEGDGNVIMIADGKISTLAERNNVERESEIEANALSGRLITIGVGDQFPREIEEEDEEFLTDLAERTEGGFYIDGHSAEDLELTFDAGGGADEMQPLVVSNSNHFITENYSPNASLFEIDGSEPRPAATELVSTSNGEPVLSTTRYGLGRITAFTADNSDLEALMDQDPSLVGRTMSWTSGPLEDDIFVEGSRIDDEFSIVSREPMNGFSRESEDRYVRSIDPNETGFHTEQNVTYSVNYRPQIEEVGYNEEEFASFTNDGNVYDEESIEVLYEDLDPEPIEEHENLDLTPYLAGLALLAYLSFVGLRKRNGLA